MQRRRSAAISRACAREIRAQAPISHDTKYQTQALCI
jgi:hypothetical protein